jgi:FkbM family methyltransferase
MKKIILFLLSPFLGKKAFQRFFEWLHLIALYGQNYGRQGNFNTSGEKAAFLDITRRLKTNDSLVMFDVGANVGNYSRFIMENSSPGCTLYSFEPSPSTFESLKNNLSSFKNCIPVNMALGKATGTLDLYYNDINSVHASLIHRDMSHWGTEYNLDSKVTIQTETLDNFCRNNNIDRIDFLKIDVEGFEYNLLLGASGMLSSRKIRFIQFEFGVCAVDGKYFIKDMFQLLSNDYDIYRILKNGLHHLTAYNERNEVFLTTNYLAVLKP